MRGKPNRWPPPLHGFGRRPKGDVDGFRTTFVWLVCITHVKTLSWLLEKKGRPSEPDLHAQELSAGLVGTQWSTHVIHVLQLSLKSSGTTVALRS
ncbi:hypothetical protein F3Y22_tig00002847pilonHSYRG00154 [Hibiscus syriacus]|uniref:Uncharacterized protein n=1 Tax=Hibiscus syriacus TaxID=106335 RepID=A0A6A3CUI3_HIBSY|nr:hypothetical protein F3Y22_tig00002847pilonHSYRG00154 [Hibiscus syriacus]